MKRTILFMLLLSLLCCACQASKQEPAPVESKSSGIVIVDGFELSWYEMEDKKSCWITKIEVVDELDAEVLTIPKSIEGKTVRKIGYRIPEERKDAECMKSVFGVLPEDDADFLIPEDVVKKVNKIEKIVLPETVRELGEGCFAFMQSLNRISFPTNLEKLGPGAIGATPNLTSIYIPEKISENLEFTVNNKWTDYTISPRNKWYKVEDGFLATKDGKMLYGSVTSMSDVKIPEGVTTIAEGAFSGWDYESVHIPSTVTSIGKYAFSSRKPIEFTVSEENPHYGKDGDCIYSKISGRLVAATVKDKTVNISDKVTALKEGTSFAGGKVKRIVIPKSVKKLGNHWATYGVVSDYAIVNIYNEKPPVIETYGCGSGWKMYVPEKSYKKYERAIKKTAWSEYIKLYKMK